MAVDSWLPVGFKLPDGTTCRRTSFEGAAWQVVETQGDGRALIVDADLATRWTNAGLVDPAIFQHFVFGPRKLSALVSGSDQMLCPVSDSRSPNTKNEALAFAHALKSTRDIDNKSPLQDAIYVERYSRLLPTYSISARIDDDVVHGYWLTGGATISAKSNRRLRQMLSWMSPVQLAEVVTASGVETTAADAGQDAMAKQRADAKADERATGPENDAFVLPGRPELETFFNDHIVHIVTHREKYKALGVEFPAAVVLHGPPGCGKTFAVDRLVDFLGWPRFQIDASSVASPYIHETSRKVAEVFDKAMKGAPSVLVIDEMDAFLADREMGSGHHRVEEVAEFLRRIPEATQNEVLIIAMTNRLDMIDPAILRRGRFDHVINVDYASTEEIRALLDRALADIPKSPDVDPAPVAAALAGRPLSDVAFVIREAARLAARQGKSQLDQASLLTALKSTGARHHEEAPPRRIGFF